MYKARIKEMTNARHGEENRASIMRIGAWGRDNLGGSRGPPGSDECFRCGERGHWQRECGRRYPVCYSCRNEGHVEAECYQGTGKRQGNSGSLEVNRWQQEDSGSFEVTAIPKRSELVYWIGEDDYGRECLRPQLRPD